MKNSIQVDIQYLQKIEELKWFSGRSILITGASGLIGTYLVSLFSNLMDSPYPPSSITVVSKTGLFPVELSGNVKVIIGDLTDSTLLENLSSFDAIFHAAGYGQPEKFTQRPFSTYNLNTFVTYKLLNHVNPDGKFMFFSTSEIYSGLTAGPFSERMVGTTSPNHPRGAYIEGKRGGEMLVSIAKSELGVDGKSFRLALAYGPGTKSDDSRALNQFIRQAVTKKSIRLLDQGESWRTYCYVRDAIELSLMALIRGTEEVYNLGGISRIQIKSLAMMIGEMTGASVAFPSRQSEYSDSAPKEVWLDLDRIMSLTNEYKFMPLDSGLERTIAWVKENIAYG